MLGLKQRYIRTKILRPKVFYGALLNILRRSVLTSLFRVFFRSVLKKFKYCHEASLHWGGCSCWPIRVECEQVRWSRLNSRQCFFDFFSFNSHCIIKYQISIYQTSIAKDRRKITWNLLLEFFSAFEDLIATTFWRYYKGIYHFTPTSKISRTVEVNSRK